MINVIVSVCLIISGCSLFMKFYNRKKLEAGLSRAFEREENRYD